jgi:hypothetical protein
MYGRYSPCTFVRMTETGRTAELPAEVLALTHAHAAATDWLPHIKCYRGEYFSPREAAARGLRA